MNDIAEQRPEFFEGEYLSASDLEQLVIYLRNQAARHTLGGHTWGIVSGLELVEQTSESGTFDVYLLPGHAVDGYGRSIVVVNPVRLSPTDLNGQPSGPVQVWLRFDQGTTSATRPGFEVCCTGDAYTRVAESYVLEFGNRTTSEQTSGISVAGETVDDPRTAPRLFDDAAPVLCDGSISYQDLPLTDETFTSLISLGQVGWLAGTPGQLVSLDDDQKLYARSLRRYQGVVAENVFASEGVIRLRKRGMDSDVGADTDAIDKDCASEQLPDPAAVDYQRICNGKPTFNELVWVEGKMRVTNDVRILGHRLEMRDANGTDYIAKDVNNDTPSTPLLFQRVETDTGTTKQPNADLELLIGKAAKGHNRFLIRQADTAQEDATDPCGDLIWQDTDPDTDTHNVVTKVAITDEGKVGIGTDDPQEVLDIVQAENAFIHLQNTGKTTELFVGAGEFGGVLAVTGSNDLRIRVDGDADVTDDDTKTKVIVDSDGRVGMGTIEPDGDAVLTIEEAGEAYMIVRVTPEVTTDPSTGTSTTEEHEILIGANDDGALVAANSDDDDLILASGGNSPVIWIKANGNVGINTDDPDHDLTVEDSSTAGIAVHATAGDHRLLLTAGSDGASVGSDTGDDLQFKMDDDIKMTLTTGGFLGIGTTSPAAHLEVRGAILLGSSGQYQVPGAVSQWRIIAGTVHSTGGEDLGGGYQSERYNGETAWYTVTYDDAFATTPIVTVSGTDGNGNVIAGYTYYQWPVVTASTTTYFRVRFINNNPSVPQKDERFSFVVFGSRV